MSITLFIVVILLMRLIQSLFNKKSASSLPAGVRPYISYIGVSKLMAAGFALISMLLADGFSGINLQMVLIASASGACLVISSMFSILALNGGTMALSSMCSSAGLIIPCVLSIFVFDEAMNGVQWVCITVLIAVLVLLMDSSKLVYSRFSPMMLVYLGGAFLSNGFVMFFQKLFGELQPQGNVSAFSFLTFFIPGVALLLWRLALTRSSGEKEAQPLPKMLYVYAAALAFAVFVINQLVTLFTTMMPPAVLFTLVNGSTTVISAIVGAVVYKERITVKSGLGILLGVGCLVAIKAFG